MQAPKQDAGRRWTPQRTVVVIVGIGLLIAVGVVAFFVPIQIFGEPEREFPEIHNQTNDALLIYLDKPGGSRQLLLRVLPGESKTYADTCAAAELSAVTTDGRVVAIRPASPGCNLNDWAIAEVPG
jgi:hypothetical protein